MQKYLSSGRVVLYYPVHELESHRVPGKRFVSSVWVGPGNVGNHPFIAELLPKFIVAGGKEKASMKR